MSTLALESPETKYIDAPQGVKSHLGGGLYRFMMEASSWSRSEEISYSANTNRSSDRVERTHAEFRNLCVDNIDDFVERVKDITETNTIVNKTFKEMADRSFKYHTEQDMIEAGRAKIKGDLFELFCAAYLNMYGSTHKLFGAKVARRNQVGWDFEARNENDTKCLIQAKYVYGGDLDVDLTTFWKQTAITEGVVNKAGSLSSALITTAHRHSLKLAETEGTFVVIDRRHLKKRCNNPGFWKTFNEDYLKVIFRKCWESQVQA